MDGEIRKTPALGTLNGKESYECIITKTIAQTCELKELGKAKPFATHYFGHLREVGS